MNGQQSFRLPCQSLPATRPRPSSRSSLCLNAPKMPHAGAALQASRGRHANTFRPCTRRPAKSPCASGGSPWKGPETAPRGLALCGGETAAMVWKSLGATWLVAAAAAQMPPFPAQRPPVSVWVTPGPQPPALSPQPPPPALASAPRRPGGRGTRGNRGLGAARAPGPGSEPRCAEREAAPRGTSSRGPRRPDAPHLHFRRLCSLGPTSPAAGMEKRVPEARDNGFLSSHVCSIDKCKAIIYF